MKRLGALALSICALSAAQAQTNVGVNIGIYQPGMYGEISIGNFPQPRVVNQRPVVIMPSQARDPMYLYIPPGHQKHWSKHCGTYNACGRPVYFVRESWVREQYADSNRGERGRGLEDGHERGNHGKRRHHED